jgi:hypothetical protein
VTGYRAKAELIGGHRELASRCVRIDCGDTLRYTYACRLGCSTNLIRCNRIGVNKPVDIAVVRVVVSSDWRQTFKQGGAEVAEQRYSEVDNMLTRLWFLPSRTAEQRSGRLSDWPDSGYRNRREPVAKRSGPVRYADYGSVAGFTSAGFRVGADRGLGLETFSVRVLVLLLRPERGGRRPGLSPSVSPGSQLQGPYEYRGGGLSPDLRGSRFDGQSDPPCPRRPDLQAVPLALHPPRVSSEATPWSGCPPDLLVVVGVAPDSRCTLWGWATDTASSLSRCLVRRCP